MSQIIVALEEKAMLFLPKRPIDTELHGINFETWLGVRVTAGYRTQLVTICESLIL